MNSVFSAARKHAVAILLLCMTTQAHANFTCSGNIAFLGSGADGELHASIGFGIWKLCNISATSYGVTPESCRGWYAALLSAQKAGTKARIYFNHANGSENSSLCSSIGNWVVPGTSLFYIDFMNS